jgi:choline dehydrogenase-like flavoprotein
MSDLPDTVDVAIIGSGIGGSTIAYGLAGSDARIAILERGFDLGAHPAARDARAIFQRGSFVRSRQAVVDLRQKTPDPPSIG